MPSSRTKALQYIYNVACCGNKIFTRTRLQRLRYSKNVRGTEAKVEAVTQSGNGWMGTASRQIRWNR